MSEDTGPAVPLRAMLSVDRVGKLTALAAYTRDLDEAMNGLAQAALELTGSRNALIAVVDEERAVIEVRYGVGADMSQSKFGHTMNIVEDEGEGIVAAVAARGKSVLLGDVRKDPRYREMFATSRSEIAVPVRDKHGMVRAVLNVESDQKERYSREQQRLCEFIANLIAIVLERTSLERRQEALYEIMTALRRSESEKRLIEQVMVVADEVLQFHSISIFLHDRERDLFVLRGSAGSLKPMVDEVGYRSGEGMTGWVCEHGLPLLLHNPQRDPRWEGRFLDFPSEEIVSYLAVPILSRGKSIGALRVIRRRSENIFLDNKFTADDQYLLETIADQISAGLEAFRSIRKTIEVERMAAWGELSAKSSHMIGNRVFALKGDVNELGHLLDGPELDRAAIQEVQVGLKTNVSRIDEILQDFRDYLTASQVSLVRADINFVVREAVMEFFPKRSPVSLEWHLAEDLPEVLVDSRRFKRAVSEIVENALSHMESGALVIKTGLPTPELLNQIRFKPVGDYVFASFADCGPGIPADQKRQIFDPFFSSRAKGMGLGLSIVKGILDAHGGTVAEIGEPGTGAEFVFLLPVSERQ